MSNTNFTRIRSDTLGESKPSPSPYNIFNTNVNISSILAGDTIIGDSFAPGCVITNASVNGLRSITDPAWASTVGYAFSATGAQTVPVTIDPLTFTAFTASQVAGAQTTTSATGVNAGVVSAVGAVTPVPAILAQQGPFPVLRVSATVAPAALSGSLDIKLVSYCP